MKKKNFVYLIFCTLILTSCFAMPTKEVGLTSPPPTATATPTDKSYMLTVATRDDGNNHMYDLLIGCLDAIPCIQTTTKLFDANGIVRQLNWSPNGQTLAFALGGGSSQDIFITQDDGKTLKNITNSEEPDELNPNWSPDGKQIVYLVGSATEPTKFLTTTLDGETKPILPDVFEPNEFLWLPNGMIAYTSLISKDNRNYQIRILNQDGTLYWLIPPYKNRSSFDVRQILSSSDGSYLVYAGDSENQTRFYLANLDNKTVQELSSVDKLCNDVMGALSQDGKWLAFLSNCDSKDATQYELYLLDLAQRQRVKLQNMTITGNIFSISWRPNKNNK